MFNFDKTYVINLESRTDRKQYFDSNFKYKLSYEYITAYHGTSLNIPKLIKQGKLNNSFYDPNGMVNKNIIACALSHRLAMESFEKSGEETCLILEDDVMLDPNKFTDNYINQLNSELSQLGDWDIVFLGRQEKYIFHELRDPPENNITPLFCKHGMGLGGFAAHSYLINKRSVKKLLEYSKPIKYAADVALDMRCNDMNVYCLKESLFRQLIDINFDLGEIRFTEGFSDTSEYDIDKNQCYMFTVVDDTVKSSEYLENNTKVDGPNRYIGGLVKLNFKE